MRGRIIFGGLSDCATLKDRSLYKADRADIQRVERRRCIPPCIWPYLPQPPVFRNTG